MRSSDNHKFFLPYIFNFIRGKTVVWKQKQWEWLKKWIKMSRQQLAAAIVASIIARLRGIRQFDNTISVQSTLSTSHWDARRIDWSFWVFLSIQCFSFSTAALRSVQDMQIVRRERCRRCSSALMTSFIFNTTHDVLSTDCRFLLDRRRQEASD